MPTARNIGNNEAHQISFQDLAYVLGAPILGNTPG